MGKRVEKKAQERVKIRTNNDFNTKCVYLCFRVEKQLSIECIFIGLPFKWNTFPFEWSQYQWEKKTLNSKNHRKKLNGNHLNCAILLAQQQPVTTHFPFSFKCVRFFMYVCQKSSAYTFICGIAHAFLLTIINYFQTLNTNENLRKMSVNRLYSMVEHLFITIINIVQLKRW